jgi:hypothetical protein
MAVRLVEYKGQSHDELQANQDDEAFARGEIMKPEAALRIWLLARLRFRARPVLIGSNRKERITGTT